MNPNEPALFRYTKMSRFVFTVITLIVLVITNSEAYDCPVYCKDACEKVAPPLYDACYKVCMGKCPPSQQTNFLSGINHFSI